VIFVLPEYDALRHDDLGCRHSAVYIRCLLYRGTIEESLRENRAENTARVIVQLVLRDFATLARFLQSVAAPALEFEILSLDFQQAIL